MFAQINMIKFLISKGCNLNARTELGSSTLHLAAQQGHPQVIYTLLDHGADPNLRNKVEFPTFLQLAETLLIVGATLL